MKNLYIIRGLPGAGKSTLGDSIAGCYCFAADDFFDTFYEGQFVPQKIKEAHQHCKYSVEDAMSMEAGTIAVTNTFTQEWEIKPYLDLAKEYDYTVFQIIVENINNTKSIHNVPEETVEKMRKRFEINL